MRMRVARGVAAALLVAGCGTPATDTSVGGPTAGGSAPGADPSDGATGAAGGIEQVLAQVEGLSGPERRDVLVALAEDEGQVSLYTSMNGDIVQEVGDAFEEQFGIRVSIYRASSEAVLQRLVQEADAGFRGADLAETNGTELFALSSEGVLTPVSSPAVDGLADGSAFDDWTATRFNFFAAAWNTRAVTEPPTRWEDLADPSWDGRLALELGDSDWYMALRDHWLGEGRSEDEVARLFEDLGRGAVTVSGHTLMTELLAAGEFDAATSNYSYIVQALVDEGAPVAWQPPVEPVFARPNGVGVVRGAPHPAAALLFHDWILSDGQEVLADQGVDVSRRDLLSTGDAEIAFVDLAAYARDRAELEAAYEAILRLGDEAEG